MDSSDQRLIRSAEEGNVDELYSILADDPEALERIDRKPVVNTPLHIAASAGHRHYALEIANIRPSLTRKLNRDGFSPIHLLLKQMKLAKEGWLLDEYERLFNMCSMLTELDRELLRVKGKDWFTPLHLATQIGDGDILVYFLLKLPSCIEDITVRKETVMHIAVKSGNIGVVKDLLHCIKQADGEHILLYKDEDGNTALQIATSTNQPEVMELLIQYEKNSCNLRGDTAMDIYIAQRGNLRREVGDILRRAKAKRAAEVDRSWNVTNFLSNDFLWIERLTKFLGIRDELPEADRNLILVLATMIVISTYLAGLNPPGGYRQANCDTITINERTTSSSLGIIQGENQHFAGEMVNRSSLCFFVFNTLAFLTALYIILPILAKALDKFTWLLVAFFFLLVAYAISLCTTLPSEAYPSGIIVLMSMGTIILVMLCVTLVLDRAVKSRRSLTVHMR